MTLVSLDMAYRSFRGGSGRLGHPPRYAAFNQSSSPRFRLSSGWSDAHPGGSIYYLVGIVNPDPVTAGSLYVHVWVGSGNVDPVIGTFLLNVDTHFSQLTQPKAFGLQLASGAGALLNF